MAKPDIPDKMAANAQDTDPSDDSDPITATYPVFLNPSLPAGRRLLVLQHPNRTDDQPRPPPTELRLKAHTGMVEVDVPVDSSPGVYDREKGIRWGRGLHSSTATKSGGSHGLAGGFGFGAVQQRGGGAGASGGRRRSDAVEDDDVMLDWNDAVRQGKALTTQTLGGQYPDTNEVQYMVGVFQGKNLHLTPVSSLVHLRPQLHHIDAASQADRRAAGEAAGAGPSTGGAAGAASSSSAAAKAIHMTVKATTDGDAVTTETMADRLRSVQSEHWRRMRYTDENEQEAWDVYNESLFLQPKEDDTQPPVPKEGAAKKDNEEEEEEVAPVPELEGKVPHFTTRWGDEEMLRAVSGIKKPKPQAPPAIEKPDPEPRQQARNSAPQEPEVAPRPRATRPRGGATAARRGSRSRVA